MALTAALSLAGLPAPPAHSASGDSPYYTVVSHPDFLNSDVGDLTRSPFWDPEAHAGYVLGILLVAVVVLVMGPPRACPKSHY